MISVTDVVNLIIDKKIKELENIRKEKFAEKEVLEEEEEKFLIDFYKKIFTDDFLNKNFTISNDEFIHLKEIKSSELYYKRFHVMFKISGLSPIGFDYYKEKINKVYAEAMDTFKQIDKIKNSKDALIAEVTLQKLSSIDADFKENIEKLTDKIFNNKQLN